MTTTQRYRSIFHTDLPADEAFAAAERELRSWLGSKHYDREAFDRGQARVGPNAVMLVQARNSSDGTQTKRWQLRETSSGSSWLTTLTVHAPGRSQAGIKSWFWLDVEPELGADQNRTPRRRAAVPRLIRSLLDAVDARDALAQLTGKPVLVRPDDVEGLLHILCDPDRRMPAIVATPHQRIEFGTWRDTVEKATRHTAGVAALYLLDPVAMAVFNSDIGETHAVWGGAIRTYLPIVDPASENDAFRHRVLTPARIEQDPSRAAGLLAGLPRQLSAEGRLPHPLASLNRSLLTRQERQAIPQPAPSTTDTEVVDSLQAEVQELQQNLDAALQLIAESERTEELLAQRNDELQALSADFDAVNQRAEYFYDQLRSLQRHLARIGQAGEGKVASDEQTILPVSFADLLDRIEELPRVCFTGDIDHPMSLDDRPLASSWAQSAWQAILAMNAYAEASADNRFSGGFLSWCKETPTGEYGISPGKVASDESETVQKDQKMRRARMLPVPVEVHPSERVFMGAHIRVGGGAGMSAPRMHYYDDVNNTGLVYIGYIGPHLRVKSTN